MDFHVIIPARYASTRFPGKVLADLRGRPMLQHVYEAACDSGAASVIIATDDARVVEEAEKFSAKKTSGFRNTNISPLASFAPMLLE